MTIKFNNPAQYQKIGTQNLNDTTGAKKTQASEETTQKTSKEVVNDLKNGTSTKEAQNSTNVTVVKNGQEQLTMAQARKLMPKVVNLTDKTLTVAQKYGKEDDVKEAKKINSFAKTTNGILQSKESDDTQKEKIRKAIIDYGYDKDALDGFKLDKPIDKAIDDADKNLDNEASKMKTQGWGSLAKIAVQTGKWLCKAVSAALIGMGLNSLAGGDDQKSGGNNNQPVQREHISNTHNGCTINNQCPTTQSSNQAPQAKKQ